MSIPKTCPHTFQDVLDAKDITPEKKKRDYKNLTDFPADTNPRKFCGNPLIYHYQMKNLLNCRRGAKGYLTLEECFNDPEELQKLWDETVKRNRRSKCDFPSATDVYECHRINRGSIVAFKSSTAKFIYKKFGAKNVLDPTAGWGGRLLGSAALGIKYTGIDTNVNLKDGYDRMMNDLDIKDCKMIYEDCLSVDFKEINPDLILTSPPYSNMEIYEHMSPWKDDDDFYKTFLIPLFRKIDEETNCNVAINISPKMYHDVIEKYDVRPCDDKVDLRQQLGQQYKTKSQDYIYVWEKENENIVR